MHLSNSANISERAHRVCHALDCYRALTLAKFAEVAHCQTLDAARSYARRLAARELVKMHSSPIGPYFRLGKRAPALGYGQRGSHTRLGVEAARKTFAALQVLERLQTPRLSRSQTQARYPFLLDSEVRATRIFANAAPGAITLVEVVALSAPSAAANAIFKRYQRLCRHAEVRQLEALLLVVTWGDMGKAIKPYLHNQAWPPPPQQVHVRIRLSSVLQELVL